MINNERVKQARELRGLTQAELATRIGVSQAAIALIEGARTQPTDEVLEAIALQTGFPPSFFRQMTVAGFPLGSLLFRARAAMTTRERAAVHRYAQIMFEISDKMAARVKGYTPRLPQSTEDPITAAQFTRVAMGLSPDTPIRNLIHALEKIGVLVLVLPVDMEQGDAFSVWAGSDVQRPVIVISGHAPGDRLRFSIGHETGHLAMHQALSGSTKELEMEANKFAAELLLPESAMREEIIPPVTLTSLVELKPRWGVSIQMLIMRSHDLGIISDRQYRYLFEQLSTRGWRTREPSNLDIPVERPRAVRKMTELIYGNPIDYERLASDTNLSIPLIRQIIEANSKTTDDSGASQTHEASKLLRFNEQRRKLR